MAVNIHITIIELNALHTKRQNLFQELDAVIHLLMEAKHWGLRKSRNATSLNSRFKSLDPLKVKIISVTFRRVIRTNHKKASKIWRHENIQLGGCQSCRLFPRQIRANTISFTVFPEIVPSIGNSFINTMKNINHTRSSISDDIRNILCSSANMRRAIPLILRLLMNEVNLSTNLASHFCDLVIGKILTSRLSLSKHLAHNLGNLLLLGKIGVFHNRRNASSRLILLISKHLILCIYLVFLIVQLHFSKLFVILKSGVKHTSRGSISTSTLPSIKLRKCSSKIITSILSFISGRLATKSNQIKQLIRNGRSASLQRTFKKSFTSFSHSTRNKTRDGLIRVRNIRALNGRFNTSITHAYSIVIGSKHITLNATGGGFLTASKQFRHGATSKSRSNSSSKSTKHKSPHLSGWRQIISLIT